MPALVEYKNISKKTLQESIESEMSGDLEKLLVAVGENVVILFVILILTLTLAHFFMYCIFIFKLDKLNQCTFETHLTQVITKKLFIN